jgi:lipase
VRLPVQRYGDPGGTELVCLHGLAGYGARFRRLAELLPGRLLVCPDLRGHGEAGRQPPWDTATHVEDVAETVEAEVEAGVPDWLGFSFGGRVLAALLARDGQAAERACLLDPALSLPPAICRERAARELDGQTFSSADEAIDSELGSGLLHRTPRELLEEEMELNLVRRADGRLEYRYSREMAIAAWSEMARMPPPVTEVPTLVVLGERSWIPLDLDRYRDALGDRLTVARVPGGHSVLWESLEETAVAVRGFLSG